MGTLFPPGRNTPKEIYEDGFNALNANLKEYLQISKQRGNTRFTVEGVNMYNKKKKRLEVLKHNERLCNHVDRELKIIEARIVEIKQFKQAKDIAEQLADDPDVPDTVISRLDQLLQRPGCATKLRDHINRAADRELAKRREEIDRITTIVQELDLPQKQREITESQARHKDAEKRVRELEAEVQERKDAYYQLHEHYHESQRQLQSRASASSAEVENLRTEREKFKLLSETADEKVQRLEKEKTDAVRETKRLNDEIQEKNNVIKKKEEDIDRERQERDQERVNNEKLNVEHRKVLDQRLTDADAKGLLDRDYKLARQEAANVQAKYNDLVKQHTDTQAELKEARKFEGQANALRVEKSNQENLVGEKMDRIAQLEKDILARESNAHTWRTKYNDAQAAVTRLETSLTKHKSDAQFELDSAKKSSDADIAVLQTKFENEQKNLETLKANAIKDGKDSRDTIRLLKDDNGSIQHDKQLLQSEKAVIQKERDDLRERVRQVEMVLNLATSQKTEIARQLRSVRALNEEYEAGVPVTESTLAAARQETNVKDLALAQQKKQMERLEDEFHQYKKLIFRYAFGGPRDIHLSFRDANVTLDAAISQNITAPNVQRALKVLEPYFTGLEKPPPLNGFQLWLEAITNPKDFTPLRVLAYLQGPSTQEFSDIGFLWLIVQNPSVNVLPGWPALAVLSILQFWLYVDPSPDVKTKVSSCLNSLYPAQPLIPGDQRAWERFVRNISLELRAQSRPDTGPKSSWGDKILSYQTPKDTHLVLSGSAVMPKIMLFRFDDISPVYFLYVESDRFVWLRPENITIRVDTSRDIWCLYDNLDPHVIRESEFPLDDVELTSKMSFFKGATYVE